MRMTYCLLNKKQQTAPRHRLLDRKGLNFNDAAHLLAITPKALLIFDYVL
jgi:hypothetical protein